MLIYLPPSFKLPVRPSTNSKLLWTDILQSYFLRRRLNTSCHLCQLCSMGYHWIHLSVRGAAETLLILGQVQLCALGCSGCWDCYWPDLGLLLVSELLSFVSKSSQLQFAIPNGRKHWQKYHPAVVGKPGIPTYIGLGSYPASQTSRWI